MFGGGPEGGGGEVIEGGVDYEGELCGGGGGERVGDGVEGGGGLVAVGGDEDWGVVGGDEGESDEGHCQG